MVDDVERRSAVGAALLEHGEALRAFVSARVPPTDVDDVLQAAAARAMERATSLRDPARVRAWLYRLHRNVITDVHRQRARQQKWIDGDALVPQPTVEADAEACACGLAQVRSLPSSYAEILRLVDVGDHSIPEAARLLGVSKNNATVRLHRARRKLRDRMRAHCGVTSLRDCLSCRCVHEGCCAA